MSLHRLQSLVYLAVTVVVYAVGDIHGIGADPVVPVVTITDGGVAVGRLIFGAAAPAKRGTVAPAVHVQIEAPQATGGPGGTGAAGRGFGLLYGLTVALDGFGGAGKQQDEDDHGRGVA